MMKKTMREKTNGQQQKKTQFDVMKFENKHETI